MTLLVVEKILSNTASTELLPPATDIVIFSITSRTHESNRANRDGVH